MESEEREEIPIGNIETDDPFLGEVEEKEIIDESEDEELDELGGQNEISIFEESSESFDMGDIRIIPHL